jgi:hypothetical protein
MSIYDDLENSPNDSPSTRKMKVIWRRGKERYWKCNKSHGIYKGCLKSQGHTMWLGTYAACGKCTKDIS